MIPLPPQTALLFAEAAPGAFNYTIIFCSILALVAFMIFLGVFAFRKPRRQRKRKSSSRRNPTLAETEGLPPVRGESSSTDPFQR